MIMKPALLAVLLLTLSPALAALPPSAYIEMQRDASEVLRINVLRVTTTQDSTDSAVTRISAVAEVLKVGRSEKGIVPGDVITIEYTMTQRPPDFVGPAPTPILEEKQETIAYLQAIDGTPDYEPAAGAMSFSKF